MKEKPNPKISANVTPYSALSSRAKPPSIETPWQNQLLKYAEDPAEHSNVVKYTDEFVILRDIYSKAKMHFLLIPRRDIELFNLTLADVPMLKKMQLMAVRFISEFDEEFKLGFHSVPSLNRLHLHIISNDFVSDKLKIKKHYLSFTTSFFIPISELILMLEQDRFDLNQKAIQAAKLGLLKGPLECHLCGKVLDYLPRLKEHLADHESKKLNN